MPGAVCPLKRSITGRVPATVVSGEEKASTFITSSPTPMLPLSLSSWVRVGVCFPFVVLDM